MLPGYSVGECGLGGSYGRITAVVLKAYQRNLDPNPNLNGSCGYLTSQSLFT